MNQSQLPSGIPPLKGETGMPLPKFYDWKNIWTQNLHVSCYMKGRIYNGFEYTLTLLTKMCNSGGQPKQRSSGDVFTSNE